MREKILITGAAMTSALGRNLESSKAALERGDSALAPVSSDGLHPGEESSLAARIVRFTTEPELSKARARRLDRGSQYAYVAVKQCLDAASYVMAGREERTGILMGTGSSGAGPLTEIERQMAFESPDAASPFLFPYTVSNAPASQTAIELGIKGPNVTLIQKDPVPLGALFYARMMLWERRADAIVVGAVDEWNINYHRTYERARLTGTEKRPGFALGEGAASVLVESEESATLRGAPVLACVAGLGLFSAAVSPHERRAQPEHLRLTMEKALEEAACDPGRIGLVHLSADGVPWMDHAESMALESMFGDHHPKLLAIKKQLGENPCIVAMQLALAADALGENQDLDAVLINAFGAGGNFISAVLTRT